MDRRASSRVHRWSGIGVAAAVLAAFVCCLRVPSSELLAVPHTITPVDHPFDPDWPDVYLILNHKCIGCHRGHDDRADFTSYDSLMASTYADGTPIVVPGQPEDSLLWTYTAWNHSAASDSDLPATPTMPPEDDGPFVERLTGGQLETIHRWITAGAREYRRAPTACERPIELDFPSAKECRVCHPRQFEQWSRSMHAYAQHSPVFEAFTLTLVERTSGTIGTFCTRCHTPTGVALGENGSLRNVNRSRLAMEGVTCVVCHRQQNPYYKASGRQAIVPGKLLDTCMYGPFFDPAIPPGNVHEATGKRHLKTSAFCGACHDVTIPQGVRLEEAFSEWQNSPAAKQGITCQQCHMSPTPGLPVADHQRPVGHAAEIPGVPADQIPLRHLSDHTFAGPDYSMLPDTEFPAKLDWMYEVDYRDTPNLTPYQRETLDQLRRANRTQLAAADDYRYQLLKNAARIEVMAPQIACPGDALTVHVDVVSTTAGHSFPTGFTAERQAWVSVTLVDPEGRPVYLSGDLDFNGDLRDEHSDRVLLGEIPRDRGLLNLQNKFTALTSRGTDRTVILSVNRHLMPLNILRPAPTLAASFGRAETFRIAKASLPPLATVGRDYRITLPNRPGNYHLDVRLNFRHLPPNLLDNIGTPHLKHLLEVVVIDQKQATLHVTPGAPAWSNKP